MWSKAFEISKWVISFFTKVFTRIWLHDFTFAQSDLIKGPVINSQLKLIYWILNSTDSKWVAFDLMREIEIDIEKTK